MDNLDYILLFIVVLVVGTGLGIVFGIQLQDNETIELGQSICEERNKGNFVIYEDGIVTCKPKPIEEKYDGIKIRIEGGR